MNYILAALCAFATVLLLMPLLIRLSQKYGFVDKPTERKTHDKPTPLIGGLAMFLGFCAAYIIFIGAGNFKHVSVLIGGALILGIGMIDDSFKTKGKEFYIFPRVLVQLISASLVFAADIRFTGFTNPFTDTYVLLPIAAQYFLTVIWIFGVTTVINWTDGLDGLAGGLTAISGCTMLFCAISLDQTDSAYMAVILIGAVLAFLKYNMFPAKIFMGDSGANFLGYILAVVALYGAFKQATVISVFVPVLALGVPIFDNLFLVIKRMIKKQPIYKADAGQIHHRLLRTGLKPTQVVTVLFLISVCLNLTSIILMLI